MGWSRQPPQIYVGRYSFIWGLLVLFDNLNEGANCILSTRCGSDRARAGVVDFCLRAVNKDRNGRLLLGQL